MYTRFDFAVGGALGASLYLLFLPLIALKNVVWGSAWSRARAQQEHAETAQDMKGRIAVVTGSNCGVGYETARILVRRGAAVVLACRDPQKGEEAVTAIQRDIQSIHTCHGQAMFVQLDLENFDSIKQFAIKFGELFPRLDILVNNGGINTSGVTSYGLQKTFCTNYLGHYYLFRLLEPKLATVDESGSNNSGGRVVNLSSVMHHVGGSDFQCSALFGTRPQDLPVKNNTYSDSKLYMNFLTMEINRRYCLVESTSERRPITAVSVNPGAVRSNIWRAIPWPISILYDVFVMRMFYLSPEQGAQPSIFACCASSNELFRSSDLKLVDDGTRLVASPVNWSSSERSGKFCGHIFVPYVVPYQCCLLRGSATQYAPAGLVSGSFWSLALEALGAFSGAQWSRATIPSNPSVTSSALWAYSEELVIEKNGSIN